MRHERQALVYIGIVAIVALIIIPFFLFPKEQTSPAKSIKRIIDYCQRLEDLESELSLMLKKDPFETLIEKEIEPLEELITKENHEIQMYLKEFSPSDMLILKDFEESVDEISIKLKIIPQRVQASLQKKGQKKSEIDNKKQNLIQDYPSFKAEISHLETVGIYLNVQDSHGKSTPKGYAHDTDEKSKLTSLETLQKLYGYFNQLESLHDKVTLIGRHSSSAISEAPQSENNIDSVITQMNKTEAHILDTIFRGQSVLRNLYPYSQALFNRIQEYFNVMQHKDYFWKNEWDERRDHLQKQYEMLKLSVDQLQESYRLRTGHKEL